MSNIKYFGFARASATVPIYGSVRETTAQDELKLDAGKVLNQLKSLGLRQDERQKFTTSNGCWYCRKDNKEIVYIMLCSPNYPERYAYSAILRLHEHLQKLGAYESEPDSSLKMHCKGQVVEICNKFENLKEMDKIEKINTNIDDIKSSVRNSTQKMIDNQVKIQDLKDKSELLKDQSLQFSNKATQLERLMYMRNLKLKIIIVLMVIALICIIVIPIATRK